MNAPGRPPPLLAVKNLHVSLPAARGTVRAVQGVSLELAAGRTLGLVGESGCGKSMLARAVMDLLPERAVVSQDSSIRFRGRELLGLVRRERRSLAGREMAMVFQDPMGSLNPVRKIGGQIAEGLRHHRKLSRRAARERAVELLRRVGVPMARRRAGHYPHQLSGGLCQRVAIAAALACEPGFLIADEPTTALDVTVQAGILDLLAQLGEERSMALLMITHDLGVAAGRTDTTAVMYAGRIVEIAPTRALFAAARMPYTRALMESVPRLSAPPHTPLPAIEGRPPDLVRTVDGCRFAPRCGRARSRCASEEPPLRPTRVPEHRFACWYPLEPGWAAVD